MGSLPTSTEYQEAVQFPESTFKDPDLKNASPRTNALGLPQPVSGAFAVVYVFEGTDRTWGVKCFLNDVPNQTDRYASVKKHLASWDLPYFVDFEYQEEGVRVGSEWYPILKMEWAEGISLNSFVEEHVSSPDTLRELHTRWIRMAAHLQEASVAHGDLQHGNVLVKRADDAFALHLVDYDTMYVPGIRENTTPEIGHRNYQHPDRSREDVGLYIDRFPSLIISTAIEACIRQPGLWERYNTGENMLFSRHDFYSPETSELLSDISRINGMEQRAQQVESCCYLEPESLPSLRELEEGQRVKVPSTRSRGKSDTRQRAVFEQWAPHATIAILVTAALLIQSGYWIGAIGLTVVGLAVIGWGGYIHYLRLQPVRRMKHLQDEEEYHKEVIETLSREKGALEEERKRILGTLEERREDRLEKVQQEALYNRLKHHFIHEARQVEGISHKVIVRLKASDVRTAYEASPERLREIRQMRGETKARVQMWRNALVSTYEDEIPEKLSPSEERRISRYIEHRTDDLTASMVRLQEKINQNERALTEIAERKATLPDIPPKVYLNYLIRRAELPQG